MAIKQTSELERVLQEGFNRQASDIFLIPGEPPAYRIDGKIVREDRDALSAGEVREIVSAAFGAERIERIGTEVGCLTTTCALPGVVDGRMIAARSLGELTLGIRLIPIKIIDLETTELPKAMLDACLLPNGLVIFSGPVGSGKTTVAFSVLDYLNETKPCHICTVEDPISFHLTPKQAIIQQREVWFDAPDTLTGIAAAMRQDLDVLFISELKTVEEIQAALTAAETGHLVITHLHAVTPEAAIQRLIDVQPEENKALFRKSLARLLRGISGQLLLPKIAGGRTPAYGVLIPDAEMREAIANGDDFMKRKSALPEGCQLLSDDIMRLFKDSIISEETAKAALGKLV